MIRSIPNYGTPFSPFDYSPLSYSLPTCYQAPSAEIKKSYYDNFKEASLFYIFYNFMLKNEQKQSFLRLTKIGWLYDKNSKTFFWANDIKGKVGSQTVTIWKISSWKRESVVTNLDLCDFLKESEI